jgi:hypothetical protein
LRRGIRALYDDAELAGRLREAALQRIRQFDWAQVTDQLLAVIREALPPGAEREDTSSL